MKHLMLSIAIALLGATMVVPDVQAKRLGGGGSSGMKRDMPSRSTPNSTPAQQTPQQSGATQNAAQPATAGAAAAAAPKRSWMGPLAGLAAGLGIAALMSHLGLGEEFGNILMMVLLAVVAVVLVRWAMRRFGPRSGAQQAPQGMSFAAAGPSGAVDATELAHQRSSLPTEQKALTTGAGPSAALSASSAATGTAPSAASGVPPGFDTAAFERIAKLIFIRMQAANDAGDAQDLRRFTTPEMFAAVQLDLQDRRGAAQHTDVAQLDAQVLDYAEEHGLQVVSVRFHGLIREDENAPAAPFDEVWHLVKPLDGSREWAIAGIAQTA